MCDIIKSQSHFGRTKRYWDGSIQYHSDCNACRNRATAKYKASHPEAQRIAIAKYLKNNKDKVNKRGRQWRKDNKQLFQQIQMRLYQARRTDIAFQLRCRISRAISGALKTGKAGRKTWDILGYSLEDLRERLESQFVDGMSWENMGKWHIDHIIPQSFFRFKSSDDVEFKMCWRLENLQPLWAKDNQSKHAKLQHS